jgi:hypothetical protein
MPRISNLPRIFLVFVFAVLMAGVVVGQGSGFNFQGRLNDGTVPANGRYDLQFRLYDAAVGGNPIGSLLARPNTVLINGVFSVGLDFGASAFANPNNIYIEISVRPNGSPNAFTILGPRQQLTIVPLAIRAGTATNADHATSADSATNAQNSVNAQNAVNATTAATATNALSLGGVAAAGWTRLNVPNTGDLLTTGRLQISGNATQFSTANGLVKAMVTVASTNPPGVVRCFNGITNSSSGNCGFTLTRPLPGVYRIDFGFPVTDRFVSATAEYDNGTVSPHTNNNGINYRLFGTTSIEFFTFVSGDSEDTIGSINFTIVMF